MSPLPLYTSRQVEQVAKPVEEVVVVVVVGVVVFDLKDEDRVEEVKIVVEVVLVFEVVVTEVSVVVE